MPRLIVALRPGVQTASTRTAALQVAGVQDAVEAREAHAVIVSIPEDELTPETRQRLADLPGATGVFDDIQGIPQIEDEDTVQDFLERVKALRGEEHIPPVVAAEPTRPSDADAGEDLRTDGGTVALPSPAARDFGLGDIQPAATISNIDDSVAVTGAAALHSRGIKGESIIAVPVDTGACGTAIRADRQLEGRDLSEEADPWTLLGPHGGMVTGIFAGDETTPGINLGYLPESDVFPIKTTLASSELILAQDIIVNLADETGRFVIANNSWGFVQCEGLCDHPITAAMASSSEHPRVIQTVAAGNQAVGEADCGQACDGSTIGISGPSSLNNILSIGATGHDGDSTALMPYSSRGSAGAVSCGSQKPDVCAPIHGTVPYGCDSQDVGNGGGTSGASPQAAGCIGLVLDAIETTRPRVFDSLETSANQTQGTGFNGCTGWGNIRVDDALDITEPEPVGAGFTASQVVGAAVGIAFLGAIVRQRLR